MITTFKMNLKVAVIQLESGTLLQFVNSKLNVLKCTLKNAQKWLKNTFTTFNVTKTSLEGCDPGLTKEIAYRLTRFWPYYIG